MCMYLKYESTISKIAKNFQRVFCYQNTKICTSRKQTQQYIQCVHGLWIHEIEQHNTTLSWRQKVVIQNTNQHIERGFPTNQINNLTSFVTLTYHEYHWGGQGHGKNTRSGYLGIFVASMKNSHDFDNVNILFLRTKMFLTTEFQEQIWNKSVWPWPSSIHLRSRS